MSSGCLLVLCGGEKRVISFEADKAYQEKKIVAIRFDRNGEVAHIKEFKKKNYNAYLKEEIARELISKQLFRKENTNSLKNLMTE